ncbi:MAG TPA: hypothetical protein VFT98_18285 [Myxococcota bacterium]|nr:hypothetical protein [Myxococcota bacterium]
MHSPTPTPTLLDLVAAVYEMSDSREEAVRVIHHMFETGIVRLSGPWAYGHPRPPFGRL